MHLFNVWFTLFVSLVLSVAQLLSMFYDALFRKDYVLFLSQRTSLLFQSDKGFFTTPLSKDFFTVPVRQRVLYLCVVNIYISIYLSISLSLYIYIYIYSEGDPAPKPSRTRGWLALLDTCVESLCEKKTIERFIKR